MITCCGPRRGANQASGITAHRGQPGGVPGRATDRRGRGGFDPPVALAPPTAQRNDGNQPQQAGTHMPTDHWCRNTHSTMAELPRLAAISCGAAHHGQQVPRPDAVVPHRWRRTAPDLRDQAPFGEGVGRACMRFVDATPSALHPTVRPGAPTPADDLRAYTSYRPSRANLEASAGTACLVAARSGHSMTVVK